MTLLEFKAGSAVQVSLCHGLERIGGISEAVAGWFIAISALFQKPPPVGRLPQAQSNPSHTPATAFPELPQKGLSYSERDTCKTLNRDDHAAAAAAALVEPLMGQVGI